MRGAGLVEARGDERGTGVRRGRGGGGGVGSVTGVLAADTITATPGTAAITHGTIRRAPRSRPRIRYGCTIRRRRPRQRRTHRMPCLWRHIVSCRTGTGTAV